jgi:hypothetical protein
MSAQSDGPRRSARPRMPSSSRSAIRSRISLSSSSVAMVVSSFVKADYGLSVAKRRRRAGRSTYVVGPCCRLTAPECRSASGVRQAGVWSAESPRCSTFAASAP